MRERLLRRPGWIGDFQAFIIRGNVVDLAVGIIIGAAFTGIVQSLVKDVFNPVIGLLTGGVDFSDRFLTIKGPVAPTIAAAKAAGAVTVNYGLFINAVIQFVIVAFVVLLACPHAATLHAKAGRSTDRVARERGVAGGDTGLAQGAGGGNQVSVASSSFSRKRTKKLLLPACIKSRPSPAKTLAGRTSANLRAGNETKAFCFFFSKKKALLAYTNRE